MRHLECYTIGTFFKMDVIVVASAENPLLPVKRYDVTDYPAERHSNRKHGRMEGFLPHFTAAPWYWNQNYKIGSNHFLTVPA